MLFSRRFLVQFAQIQVRNFSGNAKDAKIGIIGMGGVGKLNLLSNIRLRFRIFCHIAILSTTDFTAISLLSGDCLFNNLGRNGFKVSTVTDIDLAKCDKYKSASALVVGSAKEVAEASDVILSGQKLRH